MISPFVPCPSIHPCLLYPSTTSPSIHYLIHPTACLVSQFFQSPLLDFLIGVFVVVIDLFVLASKSSLFVEVGFNGIFPPRNPSDRQADDATKDDQDAANDEGGCERPSLIVQGTCNA